MLLLLFLLPFLAHEGVAFWGAGVCHRIVERSFIVNGQALPLCARCTGLYLGFLTMAVVSFLRGRRRPVSLPPLGILAILLLFLLAVGVDGINSYLAFFPSLPHLYEPHNSLRLLTGTLEGIALASLLLPILHMTLWQAPQEVRSIPNLGELGLIVLAGGMLDLLVLWPLPLSFYPLALLSLGGVVLALGVTATLLVAVLAQRAGRVTTWSEALILFCWGCLLALLEMAAMAWLRYAITGSFSFSLANL